MPDNSAEKSVSLVTDAQTGLTKKKWEAPVLERLEIAETANGGAAASDGGFSPDS